MHGWVRLDADYTRSPATVRPSPITTRSRPRQHFRDLICDTNPTKCSFGRREATLNKLDTISVTHTITVIVPDTVWTLDEVVVETRRLLDRFGVEAGERDGRVLSVPDARTVRYYGTLGLVDRPEIVNRQGRYGRRHALQLAAIKALQARGLPLADVQKRLYANTDDELNAVLRDAASALKRLPRREMPIGWREIVLEPGLRLQAAADWTPASREALTKRFEAALSALLDAKTD